MALVASRRTRAVPAPSPPGAPAARRRCFADARLQPRWVAEAFARVARLRLRRDRRRRRSAPAARGARALARTSAYRRFDRWAFGADRQRAGATWRPRSPQGRLLDAAVPQPARARPRRGVRARRGRRGAARRRGAPRRLALPGRRRDARSPRGEPLTGFGAGGAPGRRRGAARSPTSPGRAPIRSRWRATARQLLQKTARVPAARAARAAALGPRVARAVRAARDRHDVGAEDIAVHVLTSHRQQDPAPRRGEGAGDRAVVPRLLVRAAQALDPADLRGFTRIVPPADRDWADPFALEKNGRYYVFFEELVRGAGKAHIAMLELDARRALVGAGARAGARLSPLVPVPGRARRPALHDPGERAQPHASRPTAASTSRCAGAWSACCSTACAWSTPRFHRSAERWWMFANGAAGDGGGFNDELHLFHAERPARRLAAAPAQPGEVRRALRAPGRRALLAQRRALPPGADLRAALRRRASSINRVLRLTPQTYAERQVERILPPPGERPARPAHRQPRRRPHGRRLLARDGGSEPFRLARSAAPSCRLSIIA